MNLSNTRKEAAGGRKKFESIHFVSALFLHFWYLYIIVMKLLTLFMGG